jgi:hypothetical protein
MARHGNYRKSKRKRLNAALRKKLGIISKLGENDQQSRDRHLRSCAKLIRKGASCL